MALVIDVFPCLSDNYGYLVHDPETGATASIDAPEAGPIEAALAKNGWTLTDILITHHHADHTDGIAPLKAKYGAKVTGPKGEADKIDGLDVLVGGGDTVTVGSATFDVIETPGHTLGHICYFEPAGKSLFCADALFSIGCGRMFEGTPAPMWEGLKKLRTLPNDTMAYCGHEYTASNVKFALSIDGDNEALQTRAAEVESLRAAGKPTIPFNLGEDKSANPFLRADDPDLAAKMGLTGADPADVFAAIRKGKDNF